jgi:transposase
MPKHNDALTAAQIAELRAFVKHKETNLKESHRVQAILMLNRKLDYDIIEEFTGFKRSSVFALRKRFIAKGIDVIKDKRKKPPRELLTKNQRAQILDVLHKRSPKEYGLEQEYWSTWALGHLIKEQYGVKYKSRTSLYILFKAAKFTFHKPGKVYKKRDAQQVEKWKEEVKPRLEEAWKDRNIEIVAADEMILSSITTFQKIWLPAGEYPKIEVTSKRENRSFYGFLNIKTGREHAFIAEKQNMYQTVEVLKKLRSSYPKQKIILFWDNAGWHRGSVVQAFLEKDKNFEIIHFPPYAPEENPQEKVWKSARKAVSHNRYIEDVKKIALEFAEYLNSNFFEYSLLGFKSRN